MTSLFPMFMKLEGRQCLVVGAGKSRRTEDRRTARNRCPRFASSRSNASPAVREWARSGRIELELRAFHH